MPIITNNLSYKEKGNIRDKTYKNSFHKSSFIEFMKRVYKRLTPYLIISKVDN